MNEGKSPAYYLSGSCFGDAVLRGAKTGSYGSMECCDDIRGSVDVVCAARHCRSLKCATLDERAEEEGTGPHQADEEKYLGAQAAAGGGQGFEPKCKRLRYRRKARAPVRGLFHLLRLY